MAPQLLTDLSIEIVFSIMEFMLFPFHVDIEVLYFRQVPYDVGSTFPLQLLHTCQMLHKVGMELLVADVQLTVYPPFILDQFADFIPATLLRLV
jgi:hypothetical protein